MPEQTMFVQFPHPGREHRVAGATMEWNRLDHGRKFMKAHGRYIVNGAAQTGPLVFWGEWEPPSRVIGAFSAPAPGHPNHLHEPFLEVPRDDGWRQNTDPLVFGDRFLYSNCRQPRNWKLRQLAPGSLILFGSKVGPRAHPEFVLDTVFVVDDVSDAYTIEDSATLPCPGWVQDVVFEPLRRGDDRPGHPYRLYQGRPYAPSSAPFSFVPCLPYDQAAPTFPRPPIRLDRWINPNRTMGAGATPATTDELHAIWNDVVRQVTEVAGLVLGVHMDVPSNAAVGGSRPPLGGSGAGRCG